MIQQMMILMRIEMQLRHSYDFQQPHDSDAAERAPRLDDALALNSAVSDISSVLATLARSTSTHQRSTRRRTTHRERSGSQRLRRADGSGFARSAAVRRLSNMSARQWSESDSVNNDDSSSTDDDDGDSDDEDDVLNSTAPVNDAVDDFIWQQLNVGGAEGITVDTSRSSPESIPDIESISSIQSIPSISYVSSNLSLSSISNVNSYASSASPSMSYEGRQVTPGYVLCQQATAEGQCSCQFCTEFGSVAEADVDEDDDVFLRSIEEGRSNRSLADDRVLALRPWQVDILDPSTHGAAASDRSLSESVNACETSYSMSPVELTNANRCTLQPVVSHGLSTLQTSLPAADHGSSHQPVMDGSLLSLLPGTSRPPHLNYAARLRWQALASETTQQLPSDVTIEPWPFPDTFRATNTSNQFTSPTGFAGRHVVTSSQSTPHQPPTYLPPLRSSVVGSTAQRGSMYHGRTTRTSRYNGGDRTHLPRP